MSRDVIIGNRSAMHKLRQSRECKIMSSLRSATAIFLLGVLLSTGFNLGFVGRALKTANSRSKLHMATYKVTLRQEGKELAVLDVPDDKVLLDVALDAGIDLPHDCKLGDVHRNH